jgi:excisionase family DNA binding protein
MSYDPDKLLDVKEAASLLQVKPGTLYAWVERDKIPHRKVGSLVRFHRAELMAWTVEQTAQGKPEKAQRSKLRVVQ